MGKKGFALPIVIAVVILILVVIGALAYFKFRPGIQKTTENKSAPTETISGNEKKETPAETSSDPFLVLGSFLTATTNKKIELAKTYISQNANGDAFKSIIDSNYHGPSIYNKNFTYLIQKSPVTNQDGVTAEAQAAITVGGQTLQVNYLLGKESGRWHLLDSWVLPPAQGGIPSNFSDLVKSDSGGLKRSVIRLEGPANFSASSPLYGEIGFGSNGSMEEVGAFYSGPDAEPEFLSFTDLTGVWVIKVTGTGEDDFTISTEIIDTQNHQGGTYKHNIKKSDVKYFSVVYPTQKGVPIKIAPLN